MEIGRVAQAKRHIDQAALARFVEGMRKLLETL